MAGLTDEGRRIHATLDRDDRALILRRSTHPGWLSNAYLVIDAGGRDALMIDSGAPLFPLLELLEKHGARLRAILTTHRHPDHVAGHPEIVRRTGAGIYALEIEAEHVRGAEGLGDGEELRCGTIRVRAVHLPGHTAGHAGYFVEEVGLFCGDSVFAGSLGTITPNSAGDFVFARRAIENRILSLPDETTLHPGHAGPTTVGRERTTNSFIRVMTGIDPEGSARCVARGRPARLIVLARDYDGGTKAWVRFDDDGSESILPGSRVEVDTSAA